MVDDYMILYYTALLLNKLYIHCIHMICVYIYIIYVFIQFENNAQSYSKHYEARGPIVLESLRTRKHFLIRQALERWPRECP